MTAKTRLLFALFFAAGACTSPQSASSPKSPVTPEVPSQSEAAAIQAALQQVSANKSDYRIGGADLLAVTVFQQPELDRQVRVSQNGSISLPLIGAVQVGGLSLTEAEATISTKFKDYIISPQVSLFIKEYGNKKVFVLGEVSKPGSFELPTEAKLTVLEAISLAGGFSNIAAPDRTKVIRTVDGQSKSFVIEVSAITKHGQKEKDIPLEPGDVVFVPQSFF